MKKSKNFGFELIKSIHPSRPDIQYFLPKEDKKLMNELLRPPLSPKGCQMVCSKAITMLPKTNLEGGHGVGYYFVNVDGYRYINAYIISTQLERADESGFSLEIDFSLDPVGVVGGTSYFFNFDNYYETADFEKKTIHCSTSYLDSSGILRIGDGYDFTHIMRVPVMGPYARAVAINNGITNSDVEVKAYITT